MKMKQTMYYCGIALIVLSFLALVMTADPLAVGRYFGGIGAGIVLTIIGYKKSNKQAKA